MELTRPKTFLNDYESNKLQNRLKDLRKKLDYSRERWEQVVFWRGDMQSLRIFCHEVLKELEKE